MTVFDNHANFAISAVATAPSPATSGTTLTLTAGAVAALGLVAPFNMVVWPAGASPLVTNAEIVRVTGIAGDVLTIVRAQEATTAKSVAIGYQIMLSDTAKIFTDIEQAVNSAVVPQAPVAGFTVAANTQVGFYQDIDLQANANGDMIVNGLLQGVH